MHELHVRCYARDNEVRVYRGGSDQGDSLDRQAQENMVHYYRNFQEKRKAEA